MLLIQTTREHFRLLQSHHLFIMKREFE